MLVPGSLPKTGKAPTRPSCGAHLQRGAERVREMHVVAFAISKCYLKSVTVIRCYWSKEANVRPLLPGGVCLLTLASKAVIVM